MTERRLVERLLLDSVIIATDTARTVGEHAGSVLRRLDLGLGPLRLTPEGFDDIRRLTISQIRRALDIPDEARGNGSGPPPLPDPVEIAKAMLELRGKPAHPPGGEAAPSAEDEVRRRFAALLDPEKSSGSHEATLASIVVQLTPDEARILRYLHHVGEAPYVDVYAVPTLGRGSTLVTESLSVIVERAGGDHPDLGPALLANLHRLGLIRLSRRELAGHGDYQLIEASSEFDEADRHAREELGQRTKVVRRSVRLTPLGRELCRLALGTPGTEVPGDELVDED
jgi:hypothetical protein